MVLLNLFKNSFAGNNIDKATRLIDILVRKKEFSIDYLLEVAFEIHIKSKSANDIEFIICYVDEKKRNSYLLYKKW